MSIFSKRIDKRLSAYQTNLIQTHYAEVENMYRQMRGWRHDYRNHIQVLKSYAAAGDLSAISKYLDELDTDLSTVDTVIKTGNKMAVSGPRREKGMVSGWYALTRLSSDTAAISAATAKKAPLPPRSFCRSKKCNSSPKVRISSPICALFFLECYNIDRKGKVF